MTSIHAKLTFSDQDGSERYFTPWFRLGVASCLVIIIVLEPSDCEVDSGDQSSIFLGRQLDDRNVVSRGYSRDRRKLEMEGTA